MLDKNKKIKESLQKMHKKYPDAYIPKYDKKTGLPILPKEEYGDWEW